MPLTALKVRNAKPGRHYDVHGLHLRVRPSGARSWVLRFMYKRRTYEFGLGPIYDVSLADARCRAMELRRMVRAGLDPVAERGLRRAAAPTFEMVARQCYEALRKGWKDRRNASWLASLGNYVFPEIGTTRIDVVDSAAVLTVLEPIWMEIPETARRILQRIGAVLDYAHIKKHIKEEVSLRSVTRGLPRQVRHVNHHAAMPYADVPAFWRALTAQANSVGRDALKLTILTATRSGEVRGSTWAEFDLEKAVWSIPAARMKMKHAHVVPLSDPAIMILRQLRDEHEALDG